jgi:hypothetical protein
MTLLLGSYLDFWRWPGPSRAWRLRRRQSQLRKHGRLRLSRSAAHGTHSPPGTLRRRRQLGTLAGESSIGREPLQDGRRRSVEHRRAPECTGMSILRRF